MIVRRTGGRIQLITQPDHAQLAGRIMARCAALADRPRRTSILLAVAEHDNGWAEEDAAPEAGEDGTVVDFVRAPVAVRQRVWPRGVSRLAERDPWAAALVAHHAVFVYDRYRADPGWSPFFARMTRQRDDLAGDRLAELEGDYAFVRLGDLISLAYCTLAAEAQAFEQWTVRREGDRVVVTPDLFDAAVVPFEIAARELPPEPFESTATLRRAFADARSIVLLGDVATSD